MIFTDKCGNFARFSLTLELCLKYIFSHFRSCVFFGGVPYFFVFYFFHFELWNFAKVRWQLYCTLTHHLPDSYIQSCSPLSRLTLAFEPVHGGGEAPDLLRPGLEARPRPRPAPPPPLAHLARHDVVVLVRVGVGDLVQSERSTGSRDHVSANESSPCPRPGRAAPCRWPGGGIPACSAHSSHCTRLILLLSHSDWGSGEIMILQCKVKSKSMRPWLATEVRQTIWRGGTTQHLWYTWHHISAVTQCSAGSGQCRVWWW